MKVLMISLSLPPYAESQTIRSAYWIEALTRKGFEFDLITAEVTPTFADYTLYELIPGSVRVWRTPMPAYFRRLDALKRQCKEWQVYLYSNLAYRLYAPDPYCGWERDALRLARLVLQKYQPDIILSASGSCRAHLAAAVLKRETGLPWVADLGDPWSWVDWSRIDTWIKAIQNSWLERRTLPLADLLIWTTESVQRAYQRWWGNRLPSSIVIPYGYRRADFEGCVWRPASEPIRLVYVGTASRRERNLIPVIECFARKRSGLSLWLQIVGNTSKHFRIAAQKLGVSAIEFIGPVSYRDSLRFICEAGILLLIGNKSPYQIPGKTFLYLASGRPILYLRQIAKEEHDPTWWLLKPFPGVRCMPNRVEALTDFFNRLSEEEFRLWEQQARDHPKMPELMRFEQDSLAGLLAKRFCELVCEEPCSLSE